MIVLTCTNCKSRLEIDDAFAGGVCRCMYCGTIQTVPSRLKRVAPHPSADSNAPTRALYKQSAATEKRHPAEPVDPHLNELAQVVGESDASKEDPANRSVFPNRAASLHRRSSALLVSGAAALVVIGFIFWTMRDAEAPTEPGTVGGRGLAAASASLVQSQGTPNFCGVPIDERMVIYVLDRGSATTDVFPDLKEAAFQSVESLRGDRQFQIIFWNNGSDEAFPQNGPTSATAANVEAARGALDDVYAHGQSDVSTALERALACKPGAVVLVTAKGYELDEAFVATVEKLRSGNRARIHTFAVGAADAGTALRTVADRTGGQFHVITSDTLKQYARR